MILCLVDALITLSLMGEMIACELAAKTSLRLFYVQRRSQLKRLKKINILGIEYGVTYCETMKEVDVDGKDALLGQIEYWTRKIRLYEKDRTPEDIMITLLHEIFHAIDYDLKLDLFIGKKGEATIDRLIVPFTDTLVRNG